MMNSRCRCEFESGAGAWPDKPQFGIRFHALPPFYQHALELRQRMDETRVD
jgi:hypothetical protein